MEIEMGGAFCSSPSCWISALLLALLSLAAAADPASPLRPEPLHTHSHAPNCGHADDALKPARPTVVAVYYAWYHDGAHPQRPWLHWTRPDAAKNTLALQAQRPGEPAPASAARPLVGLYDSADPTIARWHVQLAKAAGIDAFLVSWWDKHNDVDQNFERGILPAAEKEGFKIALFDERAQFHDTLENYQGMLTRALRRYKDSPAYLRLDGRPVVYLYQVAREPGLTAEEFVRLKRHVEREVGPVYWIVDKIEHDTRAARSGDTDREKRIPAQWLATPGIDSFGFYSTFSNFRAHRYEELAGKYRYLTRLAHDAGKKMLLPVHPGHDNSHFREAPHEYVMPRRDGQTLRDYLRGDRCRRGLHHGHQLERMAGIHRRRACILMARSLPLPGNSGGMEGDEFHRAAAAEEHKVKQAFSILTNTIDGLLDAPGVITTGWRDGCFNPHIRDRDAATLVSGVGKVANAVAISVGFIDQSSIPAREDK